MLGLKQQQVHLGFRQAGVIATVTGSVNTGVVAFANEPNAANVGSGLLPPPVSRYPLTNWLTVSTVAASAAPGTTFKVLRKGIFTARVEMQLVAGALGIGMVGISMDCPAAQLLAAGITPAAALITLADYDWMLGGVATLQATVKAQATINVTNAMRASTLAANGTPVGTMRIHAAGTDGAVIDPGATTDAQFLLIVDQIAELFG